MTLIDRERCSVLRGALVPFEGYRLLHVAFFVFRPPGGTNQRAALTKSALMRIPLMY